MKLNLNLSRRRFVKNSSLIAASAWLGFPTCPLGAPATQGNTPRPFQIGCYTRPFDKFDWRAAFDAIAEAGYKYAGLISTNTKEWIMLRVDTTPEEAHAMGLEAAKRGLKLLSAYADFSVSQSLATGIAGLKTLIDRCAAADCPNLLLGGVSEPKHYDAYFKAIAESCDYAAEKSVRLSIKPHGGQNATGPQCRKAIERVGRRNFGLWYDPGNILYYSNGQLDPVTDAATVDGLVVGMSIKDYRHPKEVLVTPGTGRVNFPEVLARLAKGGFTSGPMLVECLAPGDLPSLVAAARRVREMLESLTGQKP
jgi:sugar phosphate isomerase/epimerase